MYTRARRHQRNVRPVPILGLFTNFFARITDPKKEE
jgi:hypothetical protein